MMIPGCDDGHFLTTIRVVSTPKDSEESPSSSSLYRYEFLGGGSVTVPKIETKPVKKEK